MWWRGREGGRRGRAGGPVKRGERQRWRRAVARRDLGPAMQRVLIARFLEQTRNAIDWPHPPATTSPCSGTRSATCVHRAPTTASSRRNGLFQATLSDEGGPLQDRV